MLYIIDTDCVVFAVRSDVDEKVEVLYLTVKCTWVKTVSVIERERCCVLGEVCAEAEGTTVNLLLCMEQTLSLFCGDWTCMILAVDSNRAKASKVLYFAFLVCFNISVISKFQQTALFFNQFQLAQMALSNTNVLRRRAEVHWRHSKVFKKRNLSLLFLNSYFLRRQGSLLTVDLKNNGRFLCGWDIKCSRANYWGIHITKQNKV
jgi:hypothetical protein